MKLHKIFSLLVILSMFIGLFASLNIVSAYSTETTGLNLSNTMDTSQQSFVKLGSKNIFLVNWTLLIYNDNAELISTLTLNSLSNTSYGSFDYLSNKYSACIIKFNETFIMIGRLYNTFKTSGTPDQFYNNFEYGLINMDTLAYTMLYGGYKTHGTSSDYDTSQDFIYNTIRLIKNTNSSGSFYFGWFSALLNKVSGAPAYRTTSIFGYICTVSVTNILTVSYSQKYILDSTSDNAYLRFNGLILDNGFTSGIPENYVYILTTNNWIGGNRANIYMISLNAPVTISFIGVTILDWTYTGYVASGGYGFVYLIGVGTYSSLINVNIVYGTSNSGSQINFCTITFNSTYVTSTSINAGVSTGSLVVRPFTVIWSSGNGNSSTIYSVGYFDDVYGTWALTGISATLTGIETSTPSWSFYQMLFLFTPQQPQSYPYYATSNNWGGFQPLGSLVGLFTDVQNGKAKANLCYGNSNSYNFVVTLNGGIFTGGSISQSPVEITLQQQVTYTLTAKLYVNSVLSGSGNFSVLTTDYNTNSAVFTAYDFTNKIDSNFSNGEFSITLQPVTAISTVYRVLRINYTLTDATQAYYTFNFGYYALGGTGYNNGGGGVPYPSPTPVTGGSGVIIGGSGGSGANGGVTETIAVFTNWQNIAIIIIYASLCGLCAYAFGFTGLIAGLNIATIICLIIGILGSLMYPAIGLMALADIALILTGSGLLGGKAKNNNVG